MSLGTIVLIIIGVIFLFGILPTVIMSYYIYRVLLVRPKTEVRVRRCSWPEDEEYVGMYNEGLQWGSLYEGCKKPVETENDGLKLYGEYFDFGAKRSVIIIPGRTEDCTYSYYFAEPFRQAGCNVLCIDNRSHGLSDGDRNYMGAKEYRDIIKWSKMLVEEYGNEEVILHGICIGASVAMNTVTADDCPKYIIAMISEGMYTTFKDSFNEHMKEGKHPRFPFTLEVMAWIRILSGANVLTDGPKKRVLRLNKPILMLHSREDTYSLPSQGQWLYDHCSSERKKLVWFDKGAHSRIRPNNKEKYDNEIIRFITEDLV